MSRHTTEISDELYQYIIDVSVNEDEVLEELRTVTANHKYSMMQIAPDQGQFFKFISKLLGAKNILEIGTFTGYSALCFATHLPADGKVVTCDISEEFTSIAKQFWAKSTCGEKIELRLGAALESLENLKKQGYGGSFDIAFIDADKENYDPYFEACLDLIKPQGLIIIDNVLWNGSVIDKAKQDKDTKAIRALNKKLKEDPRVDNCLLTVADGLNMVRKK